MKMLKMWKEKLGFVLFLSLASAPMAFAASAKDIAVEVDGQFGAVGKAVMGFFMLAGIVLVGMGLLKLKAHKDNPQQVPLSQPIMMIVIGGLLAVVLGLMTVAGDSTGLSGENKVNNDRSKVDTLFN